jgi:tetratricopeptide (TPR) repeat protein
MPLHFSGNVLLLFLASLCSLCLCGESSAQLDPETDSPYLLQIVVRVPDHPPFTPVFKDQVKRELRDSLRAAFADMVRVEVLDSHPLLQEIENKGLQPALEGWKEVSAGKIHFVLIDFKEGQYEILAGQHDGLTGLASPVSRRAGTSDRQFVARTAALLIDRDFGIVGTLETNARGPEVKVSLKAGGLGIPLDKWVKKGDVFALAQIKKVGGGQRSDRMPWALLKVVEEPKDGVCPCYIYSRYSYGREKEPLEKAPGVLGYRCLKLGTTTAPLHLRLVNAKNMTPLAGQGIAVSSGDFSAKPKEERSTQADGSIQTREAFSNIAFVKVLDGGGEVRAQIPVEILDDRTVICPVAFDRQSETQGQFERNRKRVRDRVYESHQVYGELIQELNRLIEARSGPAALEAGQRGLKTMDADLANYSEELTGLKKGLQELPKGAGTRPDLSEIEQRLAELKTRRQELQTFVDSLNKALAEANSPEKQRLRAQIEQARLLENDGDFEKAIQLYEGILQTEGSQSSIADRLKKLKQRWQVKDERHGRARAFIYGAWPQYTKASQMKEHMEEARRAFQVCHETGDSLSPIKLLKANIAHTAQLNKESEGLEPEKSEDDRTKFQIIADVADDLKKLTEEINSFLNESK